MFHHKTDNLGNMESEIISTCSEALECTVTAKYNKTLQAREVIFYRHPFQSRGYKNCAVEKVQPED
jgi:hypothetical protein